MEEEEKSVGNAEEAAVVGSGDGECDDGHGH